MNPKMWDKPPDVTGNYLYHNPCNNQWECMECYNHVNKFLYEFPRSNGYPYDAEEIEWNGKFFGPLPDGDELNEIFSVIYRKSDDKKDH